MPCSSRRPLQHQTPAAGVKVRWTEYKWGGRSDCFCLAATACFWHEEEILSSSITRWHQTENHPSSMRLCRRSSASAWYDTSAPTERMESSTASWKVNLRRLFKGSRTRLSLICIPVTPGWQPRWQRDCQTLHPNFPAELAFRGGSLLKPGWPHLLGRLPPCCRRFLFFCCDKKPTASCVSLLSPAVSLSVSVCAAELIYPRCYCPVQYSEGLWALGGTKPGPRLTGVQGFLQSDAILAPCWSDDAEEWI